MHIPVHILRQHPPKRIVSNVTSDYNIIERFLLAGKCIQISITDCHGFLPAVRIAAAALPAQWKNDNDCILIDRLRMSGGAAGAHR